MSSLSDSYPIAVQESVISASTNANMLFNFLMGIYTMTYAGTVYLYMSKRATNLNRSVVLSAISGLYILCLGLFIIGWYYLNLAVIIDGDTRGSIFDSTLDGGPLWVFVIYQILFFGVFIISDGLLIWRCYHVWGMSTRIVVVPLFLFLAQCGLFVAVAILASLVNSVTSDVGAALANNIQSAQTFVSFGTTIITTSLIGYKIHSASQSTRSSSKVLFNHIVKIVIESAAVYAIVVLVYAFSTILPSFQDIGSAFYSSYYVESITAFVGGMAPTVMVARTVVTNPNNRLEPTITHISGLHFHSQNGTDNSEIDIRGDSVPMHESKEAKGGELKGIV